MIDSKDQSETSAPLLAREVSPAQWDQYLSGHLHGHHEQSSGFAEMRAKNGFKSARIAVFDEDGRIAAGAQLLYRSFPGAGRLAIVPQGPLGSGERVDAARVLVESLETLASRIRVINYTAHELWAPILAEAGFESATDWWEAEDIALVACDVDDDAILARMKSKCRYNLRVAGRKGVEVRTGTQDDIDVFYELLKHTAKRQDFPTFPVEYLREVWSLLAPSNKVRLFIASAHGEPLANYATHWEAIRWAKSIGKKYYDLGGGEGGVGRFKGQWGGELSQYPEPMDKFFGPLGSLRQRASGQIWQNERLRNLAYRVSHRQYGPVPY
jgi:lipid II:glycine glycyltransferase (peptidoglycan interpeptide bridge formation enzyme)